MPETAAAFFTRQLFFDVDVHTYLFVPISIVPIRTLLTDEKKGKHFSAIVRGFALYLSRSSEHPKP